MEEKEIFQEMQTLVEQLPAERQRDLLELARAAKAVEASLDGVHGPHGEG